MNTITLKLIFRSKVMCSNTSSLLGVLELQAQQWEGALNSKAPIIPYSELYLTPSCWEKPCYWKITFFVCVNSSVWFHLLDLYFYLSAIKNLFLFFLTVPWLVHITCGCWCDTNHFLSGSICNSLTLWSTLGVLHCGRFLLFPLFIQLSSFFRRSWLVTK